MVELKESVSLPLPAARVWALIKEPLTVASCITGATLEKTAVPDMYTGTMRVKFGPTVVSFLGEAKITYDEVARRCTVEGRGRDKRGASNASASIGLQLSDTFDDSGAAICGLGVGGGFALTGPLEGFARTGGVHVARVLLKEFADNLAALAQATAASSTADAADAAEAADATGAATQPRATPRPSADVLDAGAVTRQVAREGTSRFIRNIKQWITGLFRGKAS